MLGKGTRYSPTVLLRVGASKIMQEEFKNSIMTFSCAANWLNYAINNANISTGDFLECVMGHTKYDETLAETLTDKSGKPLADNLLITPYDDNTYCYLRYMPTLHIPTICFYGIDVPYQLNKTREFLINFDKLSNMFEYNKNNSSVLIIYDMDLFEKDLKKAVITAVERNKSKLTSDGFLSEFNPDNPYTGRFVDYERFDYSSNFICNTLDMQPLFAKNKCYKPQSEFRFVINNIRFKQMINTPNYDFTINKLRVRLPNLHKYSNLISSSEYAGIVFSRLIDGYYKSMEIKRMC